MAARKPYKPNKFLAIGAPSYRGYQPTVLAGAETDKTVMQNGLNELKRNRTDETVFVYQLVAVCKPKPVEFIVEEFAVCKDAAKKSAAPAEETKS